MYIYVIYISLLIGKNSYRFNFQRRRSSYEKFICKTLYKQKNIENTDNVSL